MGREPQAATPGLLSAPFRPFFLGAALYALFAIPLWVWIFVSAPAGAADFDGYAWHIHEMLFGYLAAVITGFLFTAIPNWTGRLPLRGGGLGLLAALWLAGRVAVFVWPSYPATAIIDCAFLVVVALLAWREVLAGRNWRNAPICVLVSLFAVANVLFWIPGTQDVGWRMVLGVAALLLGLVGGRVTPSFTRNWLAKRDATAMPAPFGAFDKVCLVLLLLAVGAWVVEPFGLPAGILLLAAAAAHLARLIRWRGWQTVSEPLLLVLHLGYLWLCVALALMGVAALELSTIGFTAALHALTVGAIGTMTLAVMARAILGHTGRELTADRWSTVMFAAITMAALVRVLAPVLPVTYDVALVTAALAWAAAYGLFVAQFGPMLMSRD